MADQSASAAPAPAAPKSPGLLKEQPSIFGRVYYATTISSVQGFSKPGAWYKSWQDYFYPPQQRPDLVKKYESRPQLPVRCAIGPPSSSSCC